VTAKQKDEIQYIFYICIMPPLTIKNAYLTPDSHKALKSFTGILGYFSYITGYAFTVKEICQTLKEAGIENPNWQKVSSNLEVELYGQVTAEEFYQSWCKYHTSWEKLSRALKKFHGYHNVAKLAERNAGINVVKNFLPSLS